MKIADSMKMFAGSVAVYAAVASAYACGEAPALAPSSAVGSGGSDGADETGGETVGAGPVPPAMADPTPGSRLQSMYRVAEDGSRQWLGWYDTALDAPCGWMRLFDGKDYCVPSYHYLSGLYSDPTCVRQIARLNECDTSLGHARAIGDKNPYQCPQELTIFELDSEPLPAGSTLYAFDVNDACVAYDSRVMVAGDRDYPIRAEVSPSEFVASDIVRGP